MNIIESVVVLFNFSVQPGYFAHIVLVSTKCSIKERQRERVNIMKQQSLVNRGETQKDRKLIP